MLSFASSSPMSSSCQGCGNLGTTRLIGITWPRRVATADFSSNELRTRAMFDWFHACRMHVVDGACRQANGRYRLGLFCAIRKAPLSPSAGSVATWIGILAAMLACSALALKAVKKGLCGSSGISLATMPPARNTPPRARQANAISPERHRRRQETVPASGMPCHGQLPGHAVKFLPLAVFLRS